MHSRGSTASASNQPPIDFDALWSKERTRQNVEFERVMNETASPVTWAYDVWDELVARLTSRDNHDRAIASQLLARLSRSDPERRLLRDFDRLIAVTRDERFVTARHTMQSLWRIGTVSDEHRKRLVRALSQRFDECVSEKNCTLIRYDICESLRRVYDAVGDEEVRRAALALIETERDAKYKKKYLTLWKKERTTA